jgi:nicotinate dehydrogenase subunit B
MIGLTQKSTGITFSTTGASDANNSGTQYNLKNRRVIGKSVPLQNNYFKTAPLRAPNAPQTCFAYEQFVDELAYAANMDPYQFRLQNVATLATDQANGLANLTFDRWKNVLVKVGQMSNWQPKVANSTKQTGDVRKGRGIALGTFANTMICNVCDITVNVKTGKITPVHVWTAQDTGLTVYPDGVANQGIGSVIQGVSRALFEQVSFNQKQVTSLDWVTYPILRFKDSPKVTPIIVNRPELRPTGAGDHVMEHVPAAIANAFFDATGVRIRQVPMTPARVRAALAANGEGTLGVA